MDKKKQQASLQAQEIDKKVLFIILLYRYQYAELIKSFKEKGYVLGKNRIHEIPKAYERDPFLDSNGVLNFVTIIAYLEFGQIDIIQVYTFRPTY